MGYRYDGDHRDMPWVLTRSHFVFFRNKIVSFRRFSGNARERLDRSEKFGKIASRKQNAHQNKHDNENPSTYARSNIILNRSLSSYNNKEPPTPSDPPLCWRVPAHGTQPRPRMTSPGAPSSRLQLTLIISCVNAILHSQCWITRRKFGVRRASGSYYNGN